MQQLSRSELIAARFALRRADMQLAQARSVFLAASYGQGIRAVNRMTGEIAVLVAQIDKALAAKP